MHGMHFADVTPAEREVLRLVADGFCDKKIAEALGLKVETVQRRVERFYDRTGLSGRAAVVWAVTSVGCCLADPGSVRAEDRRGNRRMVVV